MGLLSTLRFILNHPLNKRSRLIALLRFVRWQLGSRLLDAPVLVGYVNGTSLLVSRGMTGATGNVYAGVHEFPDMIFVAHYIQPGDLFIDIGANIGSYSILAASCGAAVRAYEPVPSTFANLLLNIRVNNYESRILAKQLGIGDRAAQPRFTTAFDTVNHVATEDEDGISVEMVPLDSELLSGRPSILKIDVEGYEDNVISGAQSLFESRSVKAVILELNGSGEKYGLSDAQIDDRMRSFGFQSIDYDPMLRVVTLANRKTEGNTIYVRDIEEVGAVCRTAVPLRVLDLQI